VSPANGAVTFPNLAPDDERTAPSPFVVGANVVAGPGVTRLRFRVEVALRVSVLLDLRKAAKDPSAALVRPRCS
jgi:hypothetical protein